MKHTIKNIVCPAMVAAAVFLLLPLQSCNQSSSQAQAPGTAATTVPEATASAAPGAALQSPWAAVIQGMGLNLLKDSPEAPDFSIPGLDGKSVSLSGFRGHWVLLNFWATWCPPCRAEMPSIQSMYKDYQARGLVLLAVSSGEEKATVETFIKENAYTFPIFLDADGKVSYQYSIESIPTTYLIDPSGKVLAGVTGSHDWNSPAVREGLDALLK